MVIPHDHDIQQQLVLYLAGCAGHRAHAQACYSALEPLYPELTHDETTLRYQASVSKWANAVQFARLHLVNDGLIYRAGEGPLASKGVWILTPEGVRAAEHGLPERRRRRSEAHARRDRAESARSAVDEGEGIILGWNRSLWDDWPETYEGAVNIVMAGARYKTRWSVGPRLDVALGTDAWLLRQGGPFGLIGHGVVVSESYEAEHFATPGKTSRYVEVEFDVLLDEADVLSREVLDQVIPEIPWRHQFRSGNGLSPAINDRLTQLWNEHIS